MSGESGVSVTVSVEVGVNTEVVGKSVQNLPQRRELAIVNHAQQVSPSMGYWGTCTSVVHAEVCLLSAVCSSCMHIYVAITFRCVQKSILL